MRCVRAVLVVLPALALLTPPSASAGREPLSDCGSKVPAEAQRVFDDLVSAFRGANAKAIVGLMERGDQARIHLKLEDVPSGPYGSAQALAILENTYFKKHTVTSLTETKDCPKGEGALFARSYLLTTRSETAELTEQLAVRVHRIDAPPQSPYWALESLESSQLSR